jgi:hypothetical protein
MTHRQFLAWLEWEAMDMNVPGKAEYYQAQIACEVRRVLSSQPNSVRLEQFQLKFELKQKNADPKDVKELSGWLAKSWAARMGGKTVRVMQRDQMNWVYPTNPKLDPRQLPPPENSTAG